MTQLSLFTDLDAGDLAPPPPQDSGPEEAVVLFTDLKYDPSDPKSFRFTIIEDITNPDSPPVNESLQVKRATRVRTILPDRRSPKKLTSITTTAYRRDKIDLDLLAKAMIQEAFRQVREERAKDPADADTPKAPGHASESVDR